MKYPRRSGFVGYNGTNFLLKPEGLPDDHPIVLAHPDLFTDTPPPGIEPPKRKRTPRLRQPAPEPKTAKQDD